MPPGSPLRAAPGSAGGRALAGEAEPGRGEAFAEAMRGALNGGALSLLLSQGHRLGLFDVMAGLPPAPAAVVAEEAGLHVAYVRGWLDAMVAGGVVELDRASGAYRLPPEHAAVLCRAAARGSLAGCARWIPLLGGLEERLLACFESGGGLSAAELDPLRAVMEEQSERGVAHALVEDLLPRVPGLVEGLREGLDVLEVGCGRGRVLQRLARAHPRSRFRGLDLSGEAIAAARAAAGDLRNARFELRDPADLRETASCDLATVFGSLPSLARPEAALARLFAALRPGGTLLVQDLATTGDAAGDADHPLAPLLYALRCLHETSASRAAAGDREGEPLCGASRLQAALGRAGFVALEAHDLPGDDAHAYHLARRPA